MSSDFRHLPAKDMNGGSRNETVGQKFNWQVHLSGNNIVSK